MAPLVFDIETKNLIFDRDPTKLDISVVGIYDYATETLKAFEEHQFGEMWPYFEKADALIGYNIDHFDIPLLNKYYAGDLTKIKSIDLMKTVQEGLGWRPKLQDVAIGTLGFGKSGGGIDAAEWWNQGKKEAVIEYCLKDVTLTRDLYEHIKKHKKVIVAGRSGNSEITLDISSWDNNSPNKLTHSMPW